MATINDIIIQASELQPGISRLLRNSTVIVVERCHDLLVGRQVADARLSTLDQLGGGQQRLLGQGQNLRLLKKAELIRKRNID